jgi:hypothetical protein
VRTLQTKTNHFLRWILPPISGCRESSASAERWDIWNFFIYVPMSFLIS